MQILSNFVGKYKERVDQGITEELEKRLQEVKGISPHLVPVLQAMQELSVGGKRLRAMLTILGYELAGKKVDDEVIKAAVVMEIFHLGLLIQDDVMDRDNLRRGIATIHSRYDDRHIGEAVAMCAGDLTFGWGMEIVANLKLLSEQVNKAFALWGKYFVRVGYGQVLDVLKVADEASLLQILALKSGEYSCVLPLVFGATLGGAKQELINQLTEYGMELGWVFQLRDDYLAEWGESVKTGKPVGGDRREGKHSFALIYGKEKLIDAIGQHTKMAKEKIDNAMLHEIVDWVANREN